MANRGEDRLLDMYKVGEKDTQESKPIFKPVPGAEIEIINLTVFSFKELYMMLHEWFGDNEYYDIVTGDDKFETFYMEKRDQSGLKEIWAWWRVGRIPYGSKFFRYRIEMDFHMIGMTDVEIMHKGKKLKVHKGELTVKIKSMIDVDYLNTWRKNPMMMKFAQWFRWNVIKKDTQKHKEMVIDDSYKLEEVIKQFLALKGFKDLPEGFWPVKGFPG